MAARAIASSFSARKKLRVTFTLANNAVFEGTNSNTLVLEGLRIIANIKSAGVPVWPWCQIQVFGMKQSDMNALTMLAFKPLALDRNTMKLEANSGDGFTTIFTGEMMDSVPDYTGMPDVFMRVQARSLGYASLKPVAPTSYTATTDVATIVEALAAAMGKTFENNGVDTQLKRPYLPNTHGEQLKAVCQQADIDCYVDGDIIAICPKNTPRHGTQILLNASSGLIGYPSIDIRGIQLECLFNSGLRFGGPVKVECDVPGANGQWFIYEMDHTLESEKPGGLWHSRLGCGVFGSVVIASGA